MGPENKNVSKLEPLSSSPLRDSVINPLCRGYGLGAIVVYVLYLVRRFHQGEPPALGDLLPGTMVAGAFLVTAKAPIGRLIFLPLAVILTVGLIMADLFTLFGSLLLLFVGGDVSTAAKGFTDFMISILLTIYIAFGVLLFGCDFWKEKQPSTQSENTMGQAC